MLYSYFRVHIRRTEEFMGIFLIVCHCLADRDLHDSTNVIITLFWQLIQNYFKDLCVLLIEQQLF